MGANLNGKGKTLIRFAVFFLLIGLTQCGEEGRDFYMVMDTSGSMSSGTMDDVHKSLPQITDLLKKGDRVHLVRFDESAYLEKSIDIEGDLDKAEVLSWVDKLKAKGRYTDIAVMLQSLKKIQAENTPEGRKSFFIVLSDGKDDPAPDSRSDRINLKDFEATDAPPGPKKSFVYYISLGPEKSKELEEGLKGISPDVKTVDTSRQNKPGTDGQTAATGDGDQGQNAMDTTRDGPIDLSGAAEDIEEKSSSVWDGLWNKIRANWKWVAGGLAALLALLLLIWLRIRGKRAHVLKGQLHFWEASTHPDLGKTVRLNKLAGKKVTVGEKPGSKIRIKDLGASQVVLKGTTKKGIPVLKPAGAKGIEFSSQKTKGMISPGDSFQLGNYKFEYKDGNEKG
ncbi:MAG: vWA domain-containing protein [Leptospiraceae bacterium]